MLLQQALDVGAVGFAKLAGIAGHAAEEGFQLGKVLDGEAERVAVVGAAALVPAVFLNFSDPGEEEGDQHLLES